MNAKLLIAKFVRAVLIGVVASVVLAVLTAFAWMVFLDPGRTEGQREGAIAILCALGLGATLFGLVGAQSVIEAERRKGGAS